MRYCDLCGLLWNKCTCDLRYHNSTSADTHRIEALESIWKSKRWPMFVLKLTASPEMQGRSFRETVDSAIEEDYQEENNHDRMD